MALDLPGPVIRLTGVRAHGHHGVFEHERHDGQEFVVDLVAHLPVGAGGGDEISATLHYGEAAEALVEVLAGEPVDLLETLVERLLDAVERLPGGSACPRLEVTVHKPEAPLDVAFEDVSVTIHRVADAAAGHGGAPATSQAAWAAQAEAPVAVSAQPYASPSSASPVAAASPAVPAVPSSATATPTCNVDPVIAWI